MAQWKRSVVGAVVLLVGVWTRGCAEEVESSGWSETVGEHESTDEELFPELNLPRAGGPIFDPPGGRYSGNASILIYSLMGSDATIHFTTDGTTPSNASQAFHTRIFLEDLGDFTVKACVSAPGKRDSVVVTQTYHIRSQAVPPMCKAFPVPHRNGNTSAADEEFLGTFDEGVKLQFWSSTPNCDIKYTKDGSEPNADSDSTSTIGVLAEYGMWTIKVAAFPNDVNGHFHSRSRTFRVEVRPRPPRPAFSDRPDADFREDVATSYRSVAKNRSSDEILRPTHLHEYVVGVLNPDAGRCSDCVIDNDEEQLILERLQAMMMHEGLHVDESLKLYEGYLFRGSPLKFLQRLNQEMRIRRYKIRNATQASPEL